MLSPSVKVLIVHVLALLSILKWVSGTECGASASTYRASSILKWASSILKWASSTLVRCVHQQPVHTERAELSPSSWLDERPDLHNSRRVTLRPVLSHGVRQPSFTNSLIYLVVLVKGARGISVQFSSGLYSNFMVSSTFCRVQHYEPSEKWCCNLETKMCRVISYHIKNRTAQCIAMLLTYLSMEVRASISWLFGRSVFVSKEALPSEKGTILTNPS